MSNPIGKSIFVGTLTLFFKRTRIKSRQGCMRQASNQPSCTFRTCPTGEPSNGSIWSER